MKHISRHQLEFYIESIDFILTSSFLLAASEGGSSSPEDEDVSSWSSLLRLLTALLAWSCSGGDRVGLGRAGEGGAGGMGDMRGCSGDSGVPGAGDLVWKREDGKEWYSICMVLS